MPARSQLSRPTKRSKGAEPTNPSISHFASQTAPQRRTTAFALPGPSPRKDAITGGRNSSRSKVDGTAPFALIAPIGHRDSPTPGPDSQIAEEVSIMIENAAPKNTASPSLLRTIKSKIIGALKGQMGPPDSGSSTRPPAPGCKRPIDEVEIDVAARQDTETSVAENGEVAGERQAVNEAITELSDQCTMAATEKVHLSSRTPTLRAGLRPARKAIKTTEVKTSPKPRRHSVRMSVVAGSAPGKNCIAAKENGADASNLGELEIDKILSCRRNLADPTLLDLQVSWKTNDPAGDITWEPESNIQEDAPKALFQYWRTIKGGRSLALKDHDMWHVHRIEKHQVVQGTNKVRLHVYWVGSAQRSWEPEEAVVGYAEEHLEEYFARLGGRESVLRTVAPATAPKRRGQPPKPAAAKTGAAKRGITKAAAANGALYTLQRRRLRRTTQQRTQASSAHSTWSSKL